MSITRRRALGIAAGGGALIATGTVAASGSGSATPAAPVGPVAGTRTIAVLLYPGFTALDAIGPYELLVRLPETRLVFVAERPGRILSDTGLVGLDATASVAELPAPDVVLVPGGGHGTAAATRNPRLLDWVRGAHRTTTLTTSVCTGAFVLAAAGLLDGQPATTHWATTDELAGVGAVYQPGRVVRSGKVITGAGVSAGLEVGLAVAAALAGEETARALQLAIEYDPAPPFDSGNADRAGPRLREVALRLIADADRYR